VSAFFDLIEPYGRYWPYGVALLVGALLAVVDRKAFGRYVLAWLLVLVAIGGAIGMNVSPFTFQGDDHYFQSLIAMLFALAGLAGYALATFATWACGRRCGGMVS
jgi:hypothetical protein